MSKDMTISTPGSFRERLFPIGHLVATPEAMALLLDNNIDYRYLIDRHTTGDWGDMPAEDVEENARGLILGNRLMSCYPVGGERVWVITEAGRESTTILTPGEY